MTAKPARQMDSKIKTGKKEDREIEGKKVEGQRYGQTKKKRNSRNQNDEIIEKCLCRNRIITNIEIQRKKRKTKQEDRRTRLYQAKKADRETQRPSEEHEDTLKKG